MDASSSSSSKSQNLNPNLGDNQRELASLASTLDCDRPLAMVADLESTEDRKKVADRVEIKQELLRQLKIVKSYRDRKDIRDLDDVTGKWLQACQAVLQDYYQKLSETRNEVADLELGEFIKRLNIDYSLVGFDDATKTFK